jgi:IS605 OrfB family transposase
LRLKYPTIPSQIIIKSEQEIKASYQSIKSNKHKISKAICKNNLSLRLDKRLYSKFTKNDIKLISLKSNKRITVNFKLYDKIINLFNSYSVCDPLLFFKNNNIYLSVTFNVPSIIPDNLNSLGIDLGCRRLITTSEGKAINSKEYLKNKRKIRYLKRVLYSKNTKSSKRKLKKIRRKEYNFSKNYIHLVTNKILETDSSILVMEDLSKIKVKKNKFKNNNRISQIPFYMLKRFLTYKAQHLGKRVVTVNPSFTSQDDCRKQSRGVRKGCRYYTVDDLVFDADWNAAINIKHRYTERPFSFKEPLDGTLDFYGRLLSTSQLNKLN